MSAAAPWPSVRLGLGLAGRFSDGRGVTVAVVDTGVGAGATALAGAVAAGVDVTAPGGRGRADSDCAGRGTFVAGIVAARPRDGSGFAGVAPAARILPVRVTPTENLVAPDVLAAGIRAAVDGGASVIAVTASAATDSPALRTAVLDALRRNALVVAPATTAEQNRVVDGFPARYEEVLAVTALRADGAGTAAIESKVDISAPGADGVVSLAPTGTGHVTSSGDDVAAAFVAGAAALLRSYRPELTAAAVRQRLLDTADRAVGPGYGQGVVDPRRALTAVSSPDGGARLETSAASLPRLTAPPTAPVSPLWTVLAVTGGVAAVLGIAGTAAFVVSRRRRPAVPHPRTPSGSG